MKIDLKRCAKFLVVGLIAAGAVGCHKRPTALTPLPGRTGAQTPSEPAPGGLINGNTAGNPSPIAETPAGFPTGPGHPGWTEDVNFFKSDTIHFDFDSSVVKSSEKSKAAAVADYLKNNAAAAVKVEGHCDERGTEEYNRSLGERRALACREELIRLGIDANRVDTISYGEDRPADPGHDESAWKKNRRGEFVLLTPPK